MAGFCMSITFYYVIAKAKPISLLKYALNACICFYSLKQMEFWIYTDAKNKTKKSIASWRICNIEKQNITKCYKISAKIFKQFKQAEIKQQQKFEINEIKRLAKKQKNWVKWHLWNHQNECSTLHWWSSVSLRVCIVKSLNAFSSQIAFLWPWWTSYNPSMVWHVNVRFAFISTLDFYWKQEPEKQI